MNFDEWCDSQKIKGNYKEALYHSLAAKYGVEKIDLLGEYIWKQEWDTVLREIMKAMMLG